MYTPKKLSKILDKYTYTYSMFDENIHLYSTKTVPEAVCLEKNNN